MSAGARARRCRSRALAANRTVPVSNDDTKTAHSLAREPNAVTPARQKNRIGREPAPVRPVHPGLALATPFSSEYPCIEHCDHALEN
jgi:hypothetical protein